jgi:hypothetical protein
VRACGASMATEALQDGGFRLVVTAPVDGTSAEKDA